MLKKMVESGAADSFAHYALAMEFKKADMFDDALETFAQLREKEPEYLPQYLMAGQMLIDLDREDEARPWLEAGLAVAQSKGDGKTAGEIEAALALC